MDTETRFSIIKNVSEEIITEQELKALLETNEHPLAYDGFEPSGLAHLPFGIYRPLILKELQKAGIRFILYLADWFAWVNNKMGGDLEKIRKVGEYFIEVWKAAGVKNVEYVWNSDIMDKEYWKKVILIAKITSLKRTIRAMSIMGRIESEAQYTAQLFYPMMQVADVFQLRVDICQLGLDQRRANILAREVAEKFDWKKPVVVSHHMLMGLEGTKTPEGFDENKLRDIEISSKMSKSKPETCIYVHDTKDKIVSKISKAFCPPKTTENNPVLEYVKFIIFPSFKEMKIEREKKFGGDIIFYSFNDLKIAYQKGELHPLDLKNAVAEYIDKLVTPIRDHFEKNPKAKQLLDIVKTQKITR